MEQLFPNNRFLVNYEFFFRGREKEIAKIKQLDINYPKIVEANKIKQEREMIMRC